MAFRYGKGLHCKDGWTFRANLPQTFNYSSLETNTLTMNQSVRLEVY